MSLDGALGERTRHSEAQAQPTPAGMTCWGSWVPGCKSRAVERYPTSVAGKGRSAWVRGVTCVASDEAVFLSFAPRHCSAIPGGLWNVGQGFLREKAVGRSERKILHSVIAISVDPGRSLSARLFLIHATLLCTVSRRRACRNLIQCRGSRTCEYPRVRFARSRSFVLHSISSYFPSLWPTYYLISSATI